ncbi:hypothetical protein K6Y74_12635 [Burkholderia cenocepacia]|uniref:hypothetical protein n=1 Tax=Burkholderia cenocepacia TaxID=95486 RepID=UPI0022314960|nr:hypothetical protein [Burkholderia cenocepacia]MCW3644078.1 hypothetical protein [Burkholderia cenocepacia]
MAAPLPITDAMIAREFRLQRVPGSAVDAITNPLIRRCLALGAEARAAREADAAPAVYRDAKSRAANDFE